MSRDVLSLLEMAELAQVHVDTLRRHARGRVPKLPAFKVGRDWICARNKFNQWLVEYQAGIDHRPGPKSHRKE